MSLSTPSMILPPVSSAVTLPYDVQFNLGYSGKAFSILQFSVSYCSFLLLMYLQMFFGGQIEVQNTDVSTPIQGSSSVTDGYETRQANLYARVGRER